MREGEGRGGEGGGVIRRKSYTRWGVVDTSWGGGGILYI